MSIERPTPKQSGDAVRMINDHGVLIVGIKPDNSYGYLSLDADGNLTVTLDPALLGAVTETAPATDTASSGLNGRLQRVAQRLTSLIALIPGFGTALAPSVNVATVQNPAVTQVLSTAFEASKVLKASAGQIKQLTVFNSKASAQFILLMNSATVPGDGAVTLLFPPIPIAAGTILVLDFPSPLVASTGIAVCNSSTGTFTKTIGSADCAFYAQVN